MMMQYELGAGRQRGDLHRRDPCRGRRGGRLPAWRRRVRRARRTRRTDVARMAWTRCGCSAHARPRPALAARARARRHRCPASGRHSGRVGGPARRWPRSTPRNRVARDGHRAAARHHRDDRLGTRSRARSAVATTVDVVRRVGGPRCCRGGRQRPGRQPDGRRGGNDDRAVGIDLCVDDLVHRPGAAPDRRAADRRGCRCGSAGGRGDSPAC